MPPDQIGLEALRPLLDLIDHDPDEAIQVLALSVAARFPLDADACAALADRGRDVVPSSAVLPMDVALVAGRIASAVRAVRQAAAFDRQRALLIELGQYADLLCGRTSWASRGMDWSLDRAVRPRLPPADAFLGDDPATATGPEERRVQMRILQGGQRRRSFLAGATHTLRCWIGLPETDEITADQPLPATPMPPEGLLLQVQLYWRDGRGQEHTDTRPLLLPAERDARSGDCDLRLTVPQGEPFVAADLVFRYRGRIFEAVRIEGIVLAAGDTETALHHARLRVQVSRRETLGLGDSPAVDSTLVLDGPRPVARTGPPLADPAASVLLFDERGARGLDLGSSAVALRWLNETLFETQTAVVRRQAKAGPPGVEELDADDPQVLHLLRTLARHGANLFRQWHDSGLRDPGERLQLLNRTREHIPLELVYDRGVPAEDATLCAGWREALQSDARVCPVCSQVPLSEALRDRMPTVCPLGFWSLQKVIERIDPDTPSGETDATGETGEGGSHGAGMSVPTAARRSLRPIRSALFACSDKVPETERTRLWDTLTQCVPDAARVADWDAWAAAMQTHPALLLVLPHHDSAQGLDYLEIGAEGLPRPLARLGREQLSPRYINPDATDPGPIVLLLGCQTAADTDEATGYVDLTRRVQQQRASIVLGTLAKVLGRHAAPVAQELVRQLAAVRDGQTDFGTLMRRVRRRMLGQGYLMALCLVVLGDAQWRLAPLTPQPPTVPPQT